MNGNCQPYAAGTDPNKDCIDNASDPTGKCGGLCDGHAHCVYQPAGTTCGTCKSCNGVGLCNTMPADDTTCNTIDCSSLNVQGSCLDYHDLTTNRCGSLGMCKKPNDKTSCTNVTNTCAPDGGAAGASGTGGGTGTGGATGGAGRGSGGGTGAGGATGSGGASGSAGATGAGADAGTVDGGGKGGGGGGGCGCALGGTDPLGALPALLVLGGVVTARRRRR
jgi:MYXO-CTERM domain-containing protein